MADVHNKTQRSFNMSRIRSKNTKPEIIVRKQLYAKGLRGFRVYNHSIIGKPDVTFRKQKVVIFIDGCFWHKCPRCFVKPKTGTGFWMKKISGNVKRDSIVNQSLEKDGWTILRFWEHEVCHNPEKVTGRISQVLQKRDKFGLQNT
ncbi:very short patch repair endonuclease [Candidatus Woesearchaeota archaeon]|nr:very short patch repair endonuclease [Candidatus Woesearchaeota archaeon]